MEIARLVARRSHCGKVQVGCVITDEAGQKIAIGYNGLAAGGPNSCGVSEAGVRCPCVHAEANAAVKASFDGPKVAYVTLEPCVTCSILLWNCGVRSVRVLEGVEA